VGKGGEDIWREDGTGARREMEVGKKNYSLLAV
jgi:hypothetical protein